ncbi:MAG: hypothetical protein IMW91_01590 [Firmicutes bacterium]|nr:hypothetical protein [Bacillota bacterium]
MAENRLFPLQALDPDPNRMGFKAAGLARLHGAGANVPPGFLLRPTDKIAGELSPIGRLALHPLIREGIRGIETQTQQRYGGFTHPLLVSIRAEGVEETVPHAVLNVGLNDRSVAALALESEDLRFALDCYRRFLTGYGEVVFGLPHQAFEEPLRRLMQSSRVQVETFLPLPAWVDLVETYRQILNVQGGLPTDPYEQLVALVEAYLHHAKGSCPVDLVVQQMVFGNVGADSGTGVVTFHAVSNEDRRFYLEGLFLANAQGNDLYAPGRSPVSLHAMALRLPRAARGLQLLSRRLFEKFGSEWQLTFTLQKQRLFALQWMPLAQAVTMSAGESGRKGA